MESKIGWGISLFAFVLSCSLSRNCMADTIVNGGFETGNLNGWTATGTTGGEYVTTYNPHTGTHAVVFGNAGSQLGTLDQVIATTAGDYYQFSFFLLNNNNFVQTGTEFDAYWGGTKVLSLPNSPFSSSYTQYSFTEQAASTSTDIKFAAFNNPGYFEMDDVSVSQTDAPSIDAAPLPSTACAGLGLLGGLSLLTLARRRKAASN